MSRFLISFLVITILVMLLAACCLPANSDTEDDSSVAPDGEVLPDSMEPSLALVDMAPQ